MFLRTLLAFTCLAALSPAQSGDDDAGRAARKRAAIEQGGEFQEDGAEGGKVKPDDEWEKLTPEQRLNRNIRHNAAAYCTFVATPKPAKLMPGQSGVLVVTAILKGSAVMPSPAPLEVISAAQQGLATLGTLAFRPAEVGSGDLAKGYVGKPVYDNWAIFEVPVTMSPEAVVGKKQPVSIEMRFDLYDGASAQTIGRFLDRAATEIEVGLSADPRVAGGVAAAAGPGRTIQPAAAAPDDAAAGGERKSTVKTARDVGAVAPQLAAESSQPPAVTGDGAAPPVAVEEGALPMPLLLGVGGLVALVLILILARRK